MPSGKGAVRKKRMFGVFHIDGTLLNVYHLRSSACRESLTDDLVHPVLVTWQSPKASRRNKGKVRPRNWMCQCGDLTVITKGERCPKCGKSEKERA